MSFARSLDAEYGTGEGGEVTGRDAVDTLMLVLKARLLAQERAGTGAAPP